MTPPDEKAPQGRTTDSTDSPDDALVDRLRRLEWPTVRPEVRERCWDDFVNRIDDPAANNTNGGQDGNPAHGRNAGGRQSYTRREPLQRDLVPGYTHAPRPWQEHERPAQRFASVSR